MTTPSELHSQLEAASAAVRERDLLAGRRTALKREQAALRELVTDRRAQLLDEQADVETLESFSFARIVAVLRGARDAELDRERAEVEAARLRLAEAQSQRDAIKDEIEAVTTRLSQLGDVDRQWQDAVDAKEAWLAAQGGPAGRRITILAEDRGQLLAERRELAEAVDAASTAMHALRALDKVLGRAELWSIYDLYFGGGIMASEIKLEKLNQAAGFATGANRALARLSQELVDVEDGISDLSIEGPTRFFDMWCDSHFADLTVQSWIREIKQEIARLTTAVAEPGSKLSARLQDVDDRLQDIDQERAALRR